MALKNWMSWEAGVDLVATTSPANDAPNLVIHVARMVHTPVGSARSGMVFWQPEPAKPPLALCFVTTDSKVGSYFGSHLFQGTAFEDAPHVLGDIRIDFHPDDAFARIEFSNFIFEVRLSGLATPSLINRGPHDRAPFHQQGLEAAAHRAHLTVNGAPVDISVPELGFLGGAGAAFSACGLYARD